MIVRVYNMYSLRLLLAAMFSLFVGLSLSSCKHGNPVADQSLDRIESLVEEHRDSALLELIRLDSLITLGVVHLEGDAQHARYALLKTQTHDKNWIDDTNDSLILSAVRYYDDHGSKRERMLAHFYHGAILRNAGEYSLAIPHYLKASDLASNSSDYNNLGLSFLNLSLVCRLLGSIDAIEYADKAILCFNSIGDSLRENQSQIYKATALSDFKKTKEAKDIFEHVLSSTVDPLTIKECRRQYIDLCVKIGDYEKASELFIQLTPPYYFKDYSNKVYVDVYRRDTTLARENINLAKAQIRDERDSTFYYAALRNVYLLSSDYHNAYRALARKSALQDSIVRAMFSHSVASVQKEYLNQQYEHVRYVSEQRKQKWFFSSIVFLLLIAVGVAYILKKRREHQHDIDEYMENVSDLQQTLLKQENTISELQDYIEKNNYSDQEKKHDRQDKKLFTQGFKELNNLCRIYFNNQGNYDIKDKIYEKVRSLIKNLSKDSKQKELEHIIDANFNHAMENAKSPEIGLNEEDLRLFRYRVAGFTDRSICLLMQIENPDTIKRRVQRLRRKIKQSDSPFKEDLASLI